MSQDPADFMEKADMMISTDQLPKTFLVTFGFTSTECGSPLYETAPAALASPTKTDATSERRELLLQGFCLVSRWKTNSGRTTSSLPSPPCRNRTQRQGAFCKRKGLRLPGPIRPFLFPVAGATRIRLADSTPGSTPGRFPPSVLCWRSRPFGNGCS